MINLLDIIITFLDVYGVLLGLISIGLFLSWGLLVEARENKKAKEDRKKYLSGKNFIWIISVAFIPFCCWLFVSEVNPNYLGYGYTVSGFDVVLNDDNVLLGMNSDFSGGGKGHSVVNYRIQGVNLDNGIKLFRKICADKPEVFGSKNQIVWFKILENIIGMDLLTGKNLITINEKSLMKKFPEFSKGVYDYKYDKDRSLFDITSNEGSHVIIDPFTNTKVENLLKTNESISTFKVDDYVISGSGGRRILSFSRDDERQTLAGKNDTILNKDLFFLDGQFLLVDTLTKNCIILSYETLDKKNFIFRCVSFDGKLIWQANQLDLKVGDFFNSEPFFKKAFYYKDYVIIAFDGFVFSLNTSNGKKNWLTRM